MGPTIYSIGRLQGYYVIFITSQTVWSSTMQLKIHFICIGFISENKEAQHTSSVKMQQAGEEKNSCPTFKDLQKLSIQIISIG